MGAVFIALALYAMSTALVLGTSFILLQKGAAPRVPWVYTTQVHLYMQGMRSIWQARADCVVFDEELIYRPREGACRFANIEFDTTLNFAADGRQTGTRPEGTGIAVIGDSHAMGWGVADEETFAAVLQKLSGRPVYNLAVSSYGTVRELRRLERSGLLDKIDTVIIQYCDNDLDENRHGHLSSSNENARSFAQLATGGQSQTGMLRTLARAYVFAFFGPFMREPGKRSPKDFAPHYGALMAVLSRQQLVLADKRVVVFYTNSHGRSFRDFPVGRDASLPQLEFVDIRLDREDFYHLDDHMTPHGHENTAQQLFAALRQGTGVSTGVQH
jgi:hypothetical protein